MAPVSNRSGGYATSFSADSLLDLNVLVSATSQCTGLDRRRAQGAVVDGVRRRGLGLAESTRRGDAEVAVCVSNRAGGEQPTPQKVASGVPGEQPWLRWLRLEKCRRRQAQPTGGGPCCRWGTGQQHRSCWARKTVGRSKVAKRAGH